MTEIFRIEGAGVDPELVEGLAARVADPLWYLARQWQLGEFRGEDAASPVIVEAEIDTYPVDGYWTGPVERAATKIEERVDGGVPLEALAERDLTLTELSPHSRLESGAALLRRLAAAGVPGAFADALKAAYQVRLPVAAVTGDLVGLARLRILAPAACDGVAVALTIARAGSTGALAELKVLGTADQATAVTVLDAWIAAEQDLVVSVPTGGIPAWQDRAQEYRFGVSASMPGTDPVILEAPEYPGGRLDWQQFDFVSGPESYPSNAAQKIRVLATPLRFAGQPAARWWEMEEGVAYFGDLAGGEGDLARSVLAAYAAVAGDDWYVLPCRVPSGTLARVRSLNVLDNFGGWTRIASCAAGDAKGGAKRVWRWFEIAGNVEKDPDLTPLLFVPPVVATTREGDVLEEVHFRRDDMANLAWAIEARYQGIYDRAVERSTPRIPPKTVPKIPTDWTYRLGTDVPGNWFPLVPVRITGASPQIVLRRGKMATAPDATAAAGPFGMILLPGRPFLVNEAEVPPTGARVTRRYQTARSADGGIHLWAARRKTPSSGPMTHSPLEYDALAGWTPRSSRR